MKEQRVNRVNQLEELQNIFAHLILDDEAMTRIDGKYVCIKDINHRVVGDICDSHGGKVRGVLCPSTFNTILFTNTEYFRPYGRKT